MIEPIALHPLDHLIFLLLGLLLPIRSIGAQRRLKEVRFDARTRNTLYIANSIGLWVMALIVIGIWWWFDRPFARLGLVWTEAALSFWGLAVIAAFFLIYVLDMGWDLLSLKGRQETTRKLSAELGILPRSLPSYLFFIPLAISAGVCEEIIFRGYFITYFVSLFQGQSAGQFLAVCIPAVIFGLVHTYQGRQAILKVIAMALIFGLIFLLTGSIYLLILLHIAVDLVGGSIGLFFPELNKNDEEKLSE